MNFNDSNLILKNTQYTDLTSINPDPDYSLFYLRKITVDYKEIVEISSQPPTTPNPRTQYSVSMAKGRRSVVRSVVDTFKWYVTMRMCKGVEGIKSKGVKATIKVRKSIILRGWFSKKRVINANDFFLIVNWMGRNLFQSHIVVIIIAANIPSENWFRSSSVQPDNRQSSPSSLTLIILLCTYQNGNFLPSNWMEWPWYAI